jgi:hypothetical protein
MRIDAIKLMDCCRLIAGELEVTIIDIWVFFFIELAIIIINFFCTSGLDGLNRMRWKFSGQLSAFFGIQHGFIGIFVAEKE